MSKWFNKQERKDSRGQQTGDTPFSFSLILPGQKKIAGVMADVSIDGATISFRAEKCPDFEQEERVRLSLFIFESGKTVMLDALVKGSSRTQGTIQYQFGFIDTTHLLRDLDPVLVSYFNRRDAFRVKPDPNVPIMVRLMWEDHSAKGLMIDISETGIALGVDAAVARKVEYADPITMTFILPECDTPLRMVGKTAHFEPKANNIRYSIEFDQEKTADFKEHQRSITRYLMQRQMVQLKQRADRPGA